MDLLFTSLLLARELFDSALCSSCFSFLDCLEVLSVAEMTGASAQVLTQHHQSLVAELSAISQLSTELLLNCTALGLGGSCGVLQEVRDSLSTISTMQVNEVLVTHC